MERLNSVFNHKKHFDSDLNCYVSGEFTYIKETAKPLYDENGVFYMNHMIRETRSEKKTIKLNEFFNTVHYVFQKDYKFHLIEICYYSNYDDLISYQWDSINSYVDRHEQFNRNKNDFKIERPIEMCLSGTNSFSVFHNLNKKIIHFDYKQYLKNKNDFEKNNDLTELQKNQLNSIFNYNLMLISKYFMCDIEQLTSKSFDIKKQMIKRLMFNINEKENYNRRWKLKN